MKILGIHYGHNATVAFLENGKLVFAMSEERFNRLKNSNGFPHLTLEHVYKNYVKPQEVDFAVIFQEDVAGYFELKRNNFKSVRNFGAGNINFNRQYSFLRHALSKILIIDKIKILAGSLRRKLRAWNDARGGESLSYFSKALGIPKEKILFSNHHASHAYACCFNLDPNKKTLIFTMDGEGDGLSSTVNVYTNHKLEIISTNPVNVSIGYFFTEITKLLGMTPNEHEFKVMGLAPYAKQERARKLYEQHKDLLVLDENLEFKSKIPTNKLEYYLLEKMYGQRFDTIAAFAQIFLEEKVLEWVSAWIKKTGVRDLALSGGVFMSVKLNQKILELPEVNSLFVMPSGADESTALGAAAYGALKAKQQLKPITDLYLGNEYSDAEVEKYLRENNCVEKYNIEKFGEGFSLEKKVAKLLAEGNVVARFNGRAEWGARALGNRSILANPSSRDTVRVINEIIKNRDFWMPFASSILEEDQDRYLINPKKMQGPYMAITFSTTELAQKHLNAAIHPYDFTCRPQIVYKNWSPSYHALISEFKNLTSIGGVLNTSLNLHGEPNVESPKDAIHTLEDSGLEYLAIGNFLVSKK
jgi:carbamoyltransferase